MFHTIFWVEYLWLEASKEEYCERDLEKRAEILLANVKSTEMENQRRENAETYFGFPSMGNRIWRLLFFLLLS